MNGATNKPTPEYHTHKIASRLVRSWVRLYTAPLSRGQRDERRAEIYSDLYEQFADAQPNRRAQFVAQLHVLVRAIQGIPSDVTWCFRVRRTSKENQSMKQRRLRTISIACTVIFLATLLGTNLLVDNPEEQPTILWVLAVPIGFFLVGAIGAASTLLLIRDRRASRMTTAATD
jgi:hypothetical protein